MHHDGEDLEPDPFPLQVPQLLFEAGYGNANYNDRNGMIGVTQPRRVAAIASAQRIAAELNSRVGATVGYQVHSYILHYSRLSIRRRLFTRELSLSGAILIPPKLVLAMRQTQ